MFHAVADARTATRGLLQLDAMPVGCLSVERSRLFPERRLRRHRKHVIIDSNDPFKYNTTRLFRLQTVPCLA